MLRELCNEVSRVWYLCSGRRPWSRGYGMHRAREIQARLKAADFDPLRLPAGYGYRLDERVVEYPWLFARLPAGAGRLLDAGSVLNFDFLLAHPSLRAKQLFISTLAPEAVNYHRLGVSYVYEDLRATCFGEGYFDWVASLSTIEHIGLDNTMLYTADPSKKENAPDSYLQAIVEFARMLKPGGVLYLSVPFGRHRNHGWFQIFDATMLDRLIGAFSPARVLEYHYRYEADGWHVSSRQESKDCTYFDIHTARTYDPDYAAASRAVACLELTR